MSGAPKPHGALRLFGQTLSDRLRQSRFFRRLQQLASLYLKAIPNDLGRSRLLSADPPPATEFG